MKISLIACLLFLFLPGLSPNKPTGKWIKLFNGKDLKDWKIKIKDHPLNENFGNTFRVDNGLLTVNYDQYDGLQGTVWAHLLQRKILFLPACYRIQICW